MSVGIGSSRIPGAGEGLFACTDLPFKQGRCATDAQPAICSYLGTRLTYNQYLLLSDSERCYLWGLQSKPGCVPPPGWFCIDARDPNSCYGRYANDPFDDDSAAVRQ